MKKVACLFMLLVLLASLFACSASAKPVENTTSAPEATATPEATETPAPAATVAPEVVVFSDPYFEDAVRTALNKPDGDITVAEMEAITVLNLQNADWDAMNAENGGIKDISDLKYFPNLTELHLDYNDVQDLSPISTLTNLNTLTFCAVRVKDLSPLASLTKMVNIGFDWSYAPDQGFYGYPNIDFVKSMPDLEIFEAKNAGLVDISPLVGLPKLWSVFITDNQITDISPLALIKTIKEFEIRNNPITDYSVLEPYHEVFPSLFDGFQPDVDLK
ncbi:MAG: hypothetical protein VB061_01020 [Christensenella sp.]|nr:hypothetical protein [Christensenella sp.]